MTIPTLPMNVQTNLCEWARFLWDETRHPLLAVLATAILSVKVVPQIAAEYQERGKRKEFRFQSLEQASNLWISLIQAIIAHRGRQVLLALADNPNYVMRDGLTREQIEADLRVAGSEFDAALLSARGLQATMGLLFSTETLREWKGMIEIYQRVRNGRVAMAQMPRDLLNAEAHFVRFMTAAGLESGLTYKHVPPDVDVEKEEIAALRRVFEDIDEKGEQQNAPDSNGRSES